MASRLRTASTLAPAELWLALRAVAGLAFVRAALAIGGAPRVMGWVQATRARRREGNEYPGAVQRAMSRAARTLPGSTCLSRAIVAERLLRLGGADARLVVGAQRGAGPLAHTWVRSGDLIVTGAEEAGRYTELTEATTRS